MIPEKGGARDEVMAKRLGLRKEFAREKLDQAEIASLQKETIDLRTKISNAAKKKRLARLGVWSRRV